MFVILICATLQFNEDLQRKADSQYIENTTKIDSDATYKNDNNNTADNDSTIASELTKTTINFIVTTKKISRKLAKAMYLNPELAFKSLKSDSNEDK